MKKLFLATMAFLFTAALAAADDLTFATGLMDGGYDTNARAFAQRYEQRADAEVTIINLNGSGEISLALCSGKADIGQMQIGAMEARMQDGCRLRPAGDYGSETAMLWFPPGSDLDELSDMTADTKVLVGPVGSGSELWWENAVRIETGDHGNNSDWSQAVMVNDDVEMAGTLANFGDIDAVVIVMKPSDSRVETLASLGWELGELYDKDINDYEFNGKPLYEAKKAKFSTSSGRHKNWTYEVQSFYVVTAETARDKTKFRAIVSSIR